MPIGPYSAQVGTWFPPGLRQEQTPKPAAQVAALALRAHLPDNAGIRMDDSILFQGRQILLSSLGTELLRLDKPVECNVSMSGTDYAITCAHITHNAQRQSMATFAEHWDLGSQVGEPTDSRVEVRIRNLVETTIAVPRSAIRRFYQEYEILGSLVDAHAQDAWKPHDDIVALYILLGPTTAEVRVRQEP